MSQDDSDSGLSICLDGVHCGLSECTKLDIKIPDLNIRKSISVSTIETIGMLKKALIGSLGTELKDSMNFGLFIPPTAGKAGKFLLEERTLTEYGLHQDNSSLEFRYKRRLYRTANINVTRLKKLHSKTNLKTFMDYVGGDDISKVIKMLNKGLDPNYQLKEIGETPLIRACSLNKPGDMIKTLVEGGAHLDFRHSNGQTPLHAASILGNVEAVKILLDLGQSPNTVDLEGLTPLYHSTISNTGVACAERLLFDYSVIGIEDENGLQEIHQACRFGHVQHLELLLQYKADINSQTSKNGNTPLHICAYLNQESCARLLLFRGADRVIANRSGHTPYHQALLSDNKTLAVLIQYYKDEDVVLIKSIAKYNEKRKNSGAYIPSMPRSRSASGLSDYSQMTMIEDSDYVSQPYLFPDQEHTSRTRARSIGKMSGMHIAKAVNTETSSLIATKRFSRSFNNLDQKKLEPESLSHCWAPNSYDEDDNEDTISSVSGPSQRKSAKNKGKKESCGQSNSRGGFKDDVPNLTEIDTRYLPRMVALQKSTLGFGFVIRGLKASTGFAFVATVHNPALQYMEEVESGSVAARAGILKGDYILEINNQSVVSSSHEETVRLIKASGNILAMKVVTVNKAHSRQQHNYLDPSQGIMDDKSDISSIASSDMRPQYHMSTFTRSMTRPSINPIQLPSECGIIGAVLPSTYNSIPHYKSGNNNVPATYFAPIIPVSDSLDSIGTRLQRNNNVTPMARPDSIASIDSLYPMPPPPSCDFYPRESRIEEECIEDHTLKRLSNSYQFVKVPGSTSLVPPPPPPPPPCAAPPPPLPQASKPILKQPRPILKSQALVGFDNHLRNAIAKRREKLDNDQNSVASFDVTEDSSKQHVRTTLSALKQNHQYSRSQSNRWINQPCITDSSNDASAFQRTHSHVYSNNSGIASQKTDDNGARLYLV